MNGYNNQSAYSGGLNPCPSYFDTPVFSDTASSFHYSATKFKTENNKGHTKNFPVGLIFSSSFAVNDKNNAAIDEIFPSAKACTPEFGSYKATTEIQYQNQNQNPNQNTQVSSIAYHKYSPRLIQNHRFQLVRRKHKDLNDYDENNNKSNCFNTYTSSFTEIQLILANANEKDICFSRWSDFELNDHRKIVRFSKFLQNNILLLSANVVPLNTDDKIPSSGIASDTGLPYIEISCLKASLDYDGNNSSTDEYYLTSFDIIKLIEFAIGIYDSDDNEKKRKERGRIRSNLLPFWSKWTIKSKANQKRNLSNINDKLLESRLQLGNRIMSYRHRKPRGFYKDIRVIGWGKIQPALNKALQKYCVETLH